MDLAVETRLGKLRGRVSDGVAIFKGIPFAQPPFGVNHLKPPQGLDPWQGVRDALEFGPKSPQPPYPPAIAEVLQELAGAGEDCLTLNVWTPETSAAGRHPVMLWIPGGMFEFHGTGATPLYDGSRFARDGVVCVTISYRVGAEGFLYLDDGIANLGLLDQIAALEWVRDNIAAFGGDPGAVTVAGQSAGAMSVATLLVMPRARGLFRRAIVESGTAHNVTPRATAARIGRRLAEMLDVPPVREAIAAVSPERILETQVRMRETLLTAPDPAFWGEVALGGCIWQPALDGTIVPVCPIDGVIAGQAGDAGLLVGSNLEETRLFFLPDGTIDRITDAALPAMVAAYGLEAKGVDAYRERLPNGSAGDVFAAIQTDWYWRIPSLRLADAHAANARASTYMYEFAWRSPQLGGRLGAAHGVEIPFVFDTLGPASVAMTGPNPPQSLADAMHRAWVAFISNGECGWPKFDRARRATMHFDAELRVVNDPLAATLALWKGLR